MLCCEWMPNTVECLYFVVGGANVKVDARKASGCSSKEEQAWSCCVEDITVWSEDDLVLLLA